MPNDRVRAAHSSTRSARLKNSGSRAAYSRPQTVIDAPPKKTARRRKNIQTYPDTSLLHSKVFVIHGHDENNLQILKTLLQERFGLIPVVMKEQPDRGMTVIEKFERLAEQCCFAVVLLTPDDHVSIGKGVKGMWQPRGNVLFELGWFCGRLRRERILFLCRRGTHIPSDFSAVMQKVFNHRVDEPEVAGKMELEFHNQKII